MDLAHFPTREEAIDFAVGHWIEIAADAIEKRGQFCVALSGGSTPEAIYSRLQSDRIDWSRVWLFWSDERAVPPDHKESNYRMAMEAGLGQLPIPEEQIFRMEAEEDIEVHAMIYEKILKEHGLDLMMLGMGEDGHTASLFPGTEALKEKARLVVPNYVPQQESWRMTVTFPCIHLARHRVLYVLGESKRERLKEVFKGEGKYPVEQVKNALWITDQPC